MIGVTKPAEAQLEKIVLHFVGKTGNYVESKPLHGSQKSKWIGEEVFEVSLELVVNYELERVILSFGEAVKVISPNSFKQLIHGRLSEAERNYFE